VRSPPLLDEVPNELRNLIRCRIKREMAGIEDVDFGFRDILAVAFRLAEVEREISRRGCFSRIQACHFG